MYLTVFQRVKVFFLFGSAGLAACSGAIPVDELPSSALPEEGSNYIIGAGDALTINVWNNPEVSISLTVRPDGKISTPLVEDMPAVGKTPTQLARDVEAVLAEYIRSPKVTIIVGGFQGLPDQQIKVIGQATTPQAIPFREGLTVLDVIIQVGGLSQFASPNRSKVIRKVDGKEMEIKVKLGDLLNKGDTDQNIDMEPGDILIIPESRF